MIGVGAVVFFPFFRSSLPRLLACYLFLFFFFCSSGLALAVTVWRLISDVDKEWRRKQCRGGVLFVTVSFMRCEELSGGRRQMKADACQVVSHIKGCGGGGDKSMTPLATLGGRNVTRIASHPSSASPPSLPSPPALPFTLLSFLSPSLDCGCRRSSWLLLPLFLHTAFAKKVMASSRNHSRLPLHTCLHYSRASFA